MGSFDKAESYYYKALSLKREYPEALSNIGILKARGGRFDEAIELFQQALQYKPNDTITMFNIGLAYEELSRQKGQSVFLQEAIGTYDRILKIDPQNMRARNRLFSLKKKLQCRVLFMSTPPSPYTKPAA